MSVAAWVRSKVVVLAAWAGLEPSGYVPATARVPDTLFATMIILEMLCAAHGEKRGGDPEV